MIQIIGQLVAEGSQIFTGKALQVRRVLVPSVGGVNNIRPQHGETGLGINSTYPGYESGVLNEYIIVYYRNEPALPFLEQVVIAFVIPAGKTQVGRIAQNSYV